MWEVASERDAGCLQVSGVEDVGALAEMEDRRGGAAVTEGRSGVWDCSI